MTYGPSADQALRDIAPGDCTCSIPHGSKLTSGTVSCCAKHLCERSLLAVQIRALLMRAQSEKRSLVDQAASRHRRAEFPAVQHRVGDVVEHRRCASCTQHRLACFLPPVLVPLNLPSCILSSWQVWVQGCHLWLGRALQGIGALVPGDERRRTARCTGRACARVPMPHALSVLVLIFDGCNWRHPKARRPGVSRARCHAAACVAGGRTQPFYNVLVDVRQRPGSSTYVAQVLPGEVPDCPLCFRVVSAWAAVSTTRNKPGSNTRS